MKFSARIKRLHAHRGFVFVISIVAAVLATVFLIYLTPLKHLNLISPAMNEVDPAVFYAEYAKHPDDYVFIDVRSPGIYESAHAQGAINIPIENLYDEHYTLPMSGKKIALICTTGRLAAIAYGYLEDWGFINLIHIQGGLENWAYEGLPMQGKNVRAFANGATSTPDEHQ
jgi:rhodanese-related sulfurtransferase